MTKGAGLDPPTRGNVTRHEAILSATPVGYQFPAKVTHQRYDAFGNVIEFYNELARPGITDPTKVITYDNHYKTFVESVQTRLADTLVEGSVTTQYAYDTGFGQVTKTLDAHGYLKCFSSDKFGRIQSISDASTAQSTITASCDAQNLVEFNYQDTNNANTQYVETVAYNGEAAGPSRSLQFFDGMGRTYKTASRRADAPAPWFVTVNGTDAAGRPNCAGEPEAADPFDGGRKCEHAQLYVKTFYDAYGRPQLTARRGTEFLTMTSYHMADQDGDGYADNVTVQRVIGEPSVDRIAHTAVNGRGQTVWVFEEGAGSTTITYDALGRPTLIDGPDVIGDYTVDENLITIEYNMAGQRSRIRRPMILANLEEGPTWDYEYDQFSRLSKVTPPKGEDYAAYYRYDSLGRLSRRDFAPFSPTNAGMEDFALAYYDASVTSGKGQLAMIYSPHMVKMFGYDLRGQTVNERRLINGRAYQFLSNYDRFGTLQSTTFPDGETIEFDYAGNLLSEVRSVQNGTYIDNITYDAKERVDTYHLVNGDLTVDYDFNNNSQLEHIKTTPAGGSPLMHLHFASYDRASNPLSITDNAPQCRSKFGRGPIPLRPAAPHGKNRVRRLSGCGCWV